MLSISETAPPHHDAAKPRLEFARATLHLHRPPLSRRTYITILGWPQPPMTPTPHTTPSPPLRARRATTTTNTPDLRESSLPATSGALTYYTVPPCHFATPAAASVMGRCSLISLRLRRECHHHTTQSVALSRFFSRRPRAAASCRDEDDIDARTPRRPAAMRQVGASRRRDTAAYSARGHRRKSASSDIFSIRWR